MKESSINETIKLCCDIVEDICRRYNADEDQLQDCYCNALEIINSNINADLKILTQSIALSTLEYFDVKERIITCPLYIAQKIKYTIDDNIINRLALINLLNKYNTRASERIVDKELLKGCNVPYDIIVGIKGNALDGDLFAFIARVLGEMSLQDIAKIYGCSRHAIEGRINKVEYILRRIM